MQVHQSYRHSKPGRGDKKTDIQGEAAARFQKECELRQQHHNPRIPFEVSDVNSRREAVRK